MGKIGRPPKLTPEVRDKIIEAVTAGNYVKHAVAYAGVSESAFFRWMEWAEAGRSPYKEFRESVEAAKAEAVVRNVTIIQRAARTDWRAAGWYLERTQREEFGKVTRQEVSGPDGGPIEIQGDPRQDLLTLLTPDE